MGTRSGGHQALAGYGFWNAGALAGTAAILGGWAWLMTGAAVALSIGIWVFLLNMAFVATR